MVKLSSIKYPHLLIENSHLNFFGIEFDDNSLLDFINQVNSHSFICKLVDNIYSSQEFTEYQKQLMSECFPNLLIYNKN
jgi:hypothetical protein